MAASTINLQLNLSALFLLTDFSKAAGTKMSLKLLKNKVPFFIDGLFISEVFDMMTILNVTVNSVSLFLESQKFIGVDTFWVIDAAVNLSNTD